jgi:hypothetical protein
MDGIQDFLNAIPTRPGTVNVAVGLAKSGAITATALTISQSVAYLELSPTHVGSLAAALQHFADQTNVADPAICPQYKLSACRNKVRIDFGEPQNIVLMTRLQVNTIVAELLALVGLIEGQGRQRAATG